MPTFEITSPDGRKFRVTAPEGATREQALARVQQQQSQPQETYDPTEGMSGTEKFLAGVGKGFVDLGRGVGQRLGMVSAGEVERARELDAPLMKTGAGQVGNIAGNVAAVAPAMFIPGANTVAGAGLIGGALGAAQPTGEGESVLKNAAIGAATGGGVQGAFNKAALIAGNRATAKAAELAAAKTQNAPRDAAVKAAQEAGYILPPTQVAPEAPGLVNRLAEGFSGKAATAQAAAIKNQKITNALAKRELGIPENVPLNSDTLKGVRSVAGEVYKAVKQAGPIRADDAFAADLSSATRQYREIVADFPSMANKEIDDLVTDLSRGEYKSASLVELVKRLRHDGRSNLKAFDKPEKIELGRVQMAAQEAIEDLIDRNLAAQGAEGLVDVYRNARTLIAKSHTVEDALEESTGKVVASKIGRKYSSGKPLSGGLKTIGQTAEAFPKAVQNVNSSMPGLSPLDYLAGGMAGASTGGLGLAAVAARPAVRAAIMSPAWQKRLGADYSQGLLSKKLPDLLDGPYGLLGVSQMPTFLGRPE